MCLSLASCSIKLARVFHIEWQKLFFLISLSVCLSSDFFPFLLTAFSNLTAKSFLLPCCLKKDSAYHHLVRISSQDEGGWWWGIRWYSIFGRSMQLLNLYIFLGFKQELPFFHIKKVFWWLVRGCISIFKVARTKTHTTFVLDEERRLLLLCCCCCSLK